MPVNTLTPPLRKGDILTIRHGDHHRARIALIWDVPYIRRRATANNVRVLQTSDIIDHVSQTEAGFQIQEASSAEEAVAAFRPRALDEVLTRGDSFFVRPSMEAVRKVLLRDVCLNQRCRDGFVPARHRAAIYEEYQLSMSTLHEDRKGLTMQCPACIPKSIVFESEKQLLIALRVDSGGQMTTGELIEMRDHEKRLNERRLEAGHTELAFSPEVVLVVYGIGASGWMTRHPGQWLEQMRRVSATNDVNSVVYPPDFLKRKFGNLKESVLEGQCGICLGDEFGEEEETPPKRETLLVSDTLFALIPLYIDRNHEMCISSMLVLSLGRVKTGICVFSDWPVTGLA
ncbi:hypothetical protein PRZ48_008397 [Zasmidium cellare]|uniref:Uncharacterized protein n=1 Tax=Zasmidium cellare TaxID=395010 RepID=A0ABR0EG44_ZASCE|nr:hypothetical protein PRZ48_008397 [Zasmidium cellare]